MKQSIFAFSLLFSAALAGAQPIVHRTSDIEYYAPLVANVQGGFWMFNPRSASHNPPYYDSGLNYIYHTNWNASDFTAAPIPLTSGSQASRVSYYGSTVFQKGNGYAAYFINSYADPSENEAGLPMINTYPVMAAAFGGSLNYGGIRPWDRGFSSRLCMSSNYRMNYYFKESGAMAQSYFSLFLKDLSNNRLLPIIIVNWTNRDSVEENYGVDPDLGPFLATYVGAGTRYVTKQADSMSVITGESATVASMMQDKYFNACITKDNMNNIIQDLNNKSPGSFSTNLSNYIAYESFNQTEILCMRDSCPGTWSPNNESTYGAYNLNRRMHIGVTWWNNKVQSLN